jgi:hypothetical protein
MLSNDPDLGSDFPFRVSSSRGRRKARDQGESDLLFTLVLTYPVYAVMFASVLWVQQICPENPPSH